MNYQYTNAHHTDHAPANISLYPFFTAKSYYLGGALLSLRKVTTYANKVYEMFIILLFNRNIILITPETS